MPTESLTWVKCTATRVAKNMLEGPLQSTKTYQIRKKNCELRSNLEEEGWKQEWPKSKDPCNEDNQAPCHTCVEVDVVPAIEMV